MSPTFTYAERGFKITVNKNLNNQLFNKSEKIDLITLKRPSFFVSRFLFS